MNLAPRPNGRIQHGGRAAPIPQRILDRIESRTCIGALRVARTREGCDLWMHGLNGSGHGQISWQEDGVDFTAVVTNLVYRAGRMDGRDLPRRTQINHTCDVRTCVNLDHLYLGTHSMNMSDLHRRDSARNQGVRELEVATQLALRMDDLCLPTWLAREAAYFGFNNPTPGRRISA